MQPAWNPCPHPGSVRTAEDSELPTPLAASSDKHTAHSCCDVAGDDEGVSAAASVAAPSLTPSSQEEDEARWARTAAAAAVAQAAMVTAAIASIDRSLSVWAHEMRAPVYVCVGARSKTPTWAHQRRERMKGEVSTSRN
jgi:hypothetical protein